MKAILWLPLTVPGWQQDVVAGTQAGLFDSRLQTPRSCLTNIVPNRLITRSAESGGVLAMVTPRIAI